MEGEEDGKVVVVVVISLSLVYESRVGWEKVVIQETATPWPQENLMGIAIMSFGWQPLGET